MNYAKSLTQIAAAAFITGTTLGSGLVLGSWAMGKLLNHSTTVVTVEDKTEEKK
jgi:hypothetical protein